MQCWVGRLGRTEMASLLPLEARWSISFSAIELPLYKWETAEGQNQSPSANKVPCPLGGHSVTQVSATHRRSASAPGISSTVGHLLPHHRTTLPSADTLDFI